MKRIFPLVTLVIGLALGASIGTVYADQHAARPAYVLVSGRIIDADELDPYRAAAGPLALAAGIEMVARAEAATLHVLEGQWPHDGFVALERYRSMSDFLEFWNSPGYQQAKRLRAGKVELDFVVAIESME